MSPLEVLFLILFVLLGTAVLPVFGRTLKRLDEYQNAKRWGRAPKYDPWSWF